MSLMQRLMAQRLAKAANDTPERAAPTRSDAPLQHRHRLRAELAGSVETRPAPVPTSALKPMAPAVFDKSGEPVRMRCIPADGPGAPASRVGGSCFAINADTGRQCALPGGHAGEHRHGRTAFTRVATPGQTSFTRRDALDSMAGRRLGNPFTTSQGEP